MINFIKTNKSTKGSPIIPNIAYWITFMTPISKLAVIIKKKQQHEKDDCNIYFNTPWFQNIFPRHL